jgi:hypothetical protein
MTAADAAGISGAKDSGNWLLQILNENGPYMVGTMLLILLVVLLGWGLITERIVMGPQYKRLESQLEASTQLHLLKESTRLDAIEEQQTETIGLAKQMVDTGKDTYRLVEVIKDDLRDFKTQIGGGRSVG